MDRQHFRNRAKELETLAGRLTTLSALPERTTTDDLRDAADLARKAAADLTTLVKAELPGCICPRIQRDDYDYLEYVQNCRHHSDLYHQREGSKARYAELEKALKDEARMKIVIAALNGAALSSHSPSAIIANALDVANEALRKIGGES